MKNSLIKSEILIIKFGGLGDFCLSLNAMYNIKKKFFRDNLTLLTEKKFEKIAAKSNWFNKIICMKRNFFHFFDRLEIKRKIDYKNIDVVFDLQTSERSTGYFEVFKEFGTLWSGLVEDSTLFHSNPKRDLMHTFQRQKEQLSVANIKGYSKPDFNWLFDGKSKRFENFILIVPGGSSRRRNKRIPINIYNSIIDKILKRNFLPILIGGADEFELCSIIKTNFPKSENLCNQLDILELARLSKNAKFIIGNDTGPMHLFSLKNLRMLVFFTKNSDPNLCAPIGDNTEIFEYNGNDSFFTNKVLKIIDKL